ncbi:MAG: cell division protein FtsQ/DivIB [Acidobacteriaceae bacterium]
MLVDDELELLRPAAGSQSPGRSRSRIEKEFLPEKFGAGTPARPFGEFRNEVRERRRGPVHKGLLPAWTRTRWGRWLLVALVACAVAAVVMAALAVRDYFEHDARFRIDTSSSIQTVGNSELTREQLLSVFGADIGRNIFYVPMAARRAALEQIPWVEHATVMRILPDQLRVAVRERVPVAFVRVGDKIKLVDAAGVILDMTPEMMAERHFSFPVVTGIKAEDPLPVRAARMELYEKFIHVLDGDGRTFVANLSEVDLSDPEDVRVTVPVKSSDLLLHFGDKNFLARYKIFESHLSAWEQQYPQLAAVDLRYDSEVVLKMADQGSGTGAQGSGPSAQGSGIATPAPLKNAVPAKKAVAKKVVAKKKAVAKKVVHHTTRHARKKR